MPTPFANLGFEIAGVHPGDAQSWNYNFLAQGQILAAIDPSPQRPAEDFERGWSIDDYVSAFAADDSDLDQAQYSVSPGPGHFGENFEDHWASNEGFSFSLINSAQAAYGTTHQASENFEREWDSNESYMYSWADVPSPTIAIYNSTLDDHDGFEREWRSNESYAFDISGTTPIPAFYGFSIGLHSIGLHNREDFEEAVAPAPFTVDVSTSTINATANGLTDDIKVKFFAGPDGLLPTGIDSVNPWYVVNSTTNTFQVSSTPGGPPVTIANAGFGSYFWIEPYAFWTQFLGPV